MRRNNRYPLKAMALMSTILSQLAGSLLVGIFVGRWLDEKLGAAPLFLVVGLLLGLAAGIFSMLRTVRRYFSGE
ncbi:AtpZ/AtpI family protein [Bacillus sp. V5-8f]|uniref:AtpZ/AtpI family protein n=1 Tax=Bacillus sp. V5-8f TaxID=2053044 RepID=UPI000C79469B|nr:AtpZ/AtpI family protein [Bacillus sp. V5-8f]PLT35871.1 hypothetical protein CUU64_00930 [Bacillus sp. V5-8f]